MLRGGYAEVSKLRAIGRDVDPAKSLLGSNFDEADYVEPGLIFEVEAEAETVDVEPYVPQGCNSSSSAASASR